MKFSTAHLSTSISKEPFEGGSVQYEPVSFLIERKNETHLEDKMLRLFVLNCTVGDDNKKLVSQTNTGGSSKYRKVSNNHTYNRFFSMADLSNPPKCAVVLPRTIQETTVLLKPLNGAQMVGQAFLVFEPKVVANMMNGVTPILNLSNSPFLPVSSVEDSLPEDTERYITMPSTANEAHYFILKNKGINISLFKLAGDLSCHGIMCDRQKLVSKCSCLYATRRSTNVYEFHVTFPFPLNTEESDGKETVLFRSLSTSNIFFQDGLDSHTTKRDEQQQEKKQRMIRSKVAQMVEYVNGNGGWTIVGWYMMGQIQDAAANSHEKVDNTNIQVHMSYLMPTRLAVLQKTEEFAKLQIAESDYNQDINQETNDTQPV